MVASVVRVGRPSRVVTGPELEKSYHQLRLAKHALIYVVLYDFARKEKAFALGDVIRCLRKVFAVTLIYQAMEDTGADGWFILMEDPQSKSKRFHFNQSVWRPVALNGRCIWKQSELRELDERRIPIQRKSIEVALA
jgi:hypothetical protein